MRQTVRLDAESSPPGVPLRDRLARGPTRAEGALPGRRARPARDLRDAVRRRRAPDALLDAPRPRAVRGPRPPLRRPLRARLRRRPAVRRDLRLVRPRNRDAHDASCARRGGPTPKPTSATTSSPSRSTPIAAAGRRPASPRRPCASTRRCCSATGGRAALLVLHRHPGLLVDTVKRAEDGDELIVRLYEAHGGRGTARLRVGVPFTEAWFTNLLEDRLGPPRSTATRSSIPFRPFEIVTLRLR